MVFLFLAFSSSAFYYTVRNIAYKWVVFGRSRVGFLVLEVHNEGEISFGSDTRTLLYLLDFIFHYTFAELSFFIIHFG